MLTREQISVLVQAGGAAPSGGNIQPWRVVAGPTEIAVWLDEIRSSSFLDIGRYASVLALGAFTENLTLKAVELGLGYELHASDEVTLEAPMVRFRFGSTSGAGNDRGSWPTAAGARDALAQYIPQRCTNRRPHDGPPVGDDALQAMVVATGDDAYLSHVGADRYKRAVAEILAQTDALRLRHAELHRQMWKEVRFSPDEVERTADGVDVATLELPPGGIEEMQRLTDYRFVMDNVPIDALKAGSMPALMASSHLCCLSVREPPSSGRILAAGRAMQRMWLTATRLELAIQPWSVLPFLAMRVRYSSEGGFARDEREQLLSLHDRLTGIFGLAEGTMPLFLFRLARCGPPSARALRRDWRSYTTLSE